MAEDPDKTIDQMEVAEGAEALSETVIRLLDQPALRETVQHMEGIGGHGIEAGLSTENALGYIKKFSQNELGINEIPEVLRKPVVQAVHGGFSEEVKANSEMILGPENNINGGATAVRGSVEWNGSKYSRLTKLVFINPLGSIKANGNFDPDKQQELVKKGLRSVELVYLSGNLGSTDTGKQVYEAHYTNEGDKNDPDRLPLEERGLTLNQMVLADSLNRSNAFEADRHNAPTMLVRTTTE